MRDIWTTAFGVQRRLRKRFGERPTIAAMLVGSRETAACLLALLTNGSRVVSLPTPPRTGGLDSYAVTLKEIVKSTDPQVVLVDGDYVEVIQVALEGLAPVVAYGQLSADSPVSRNQVGQGVGGELIQFTSGTTSAPRGVLVTSQALGRCVEATLAEIRPQASDVVVSWLPWSHDMGLVGMFLACIAGSAPQFAGSGRLVTLRPERYLRQPRTWLESCSVFKANITAVPPFALDLANHDPHPSSAMGRAGPIDLSRMRTLIVGGSVVGANTLRTFEATYADVGLTETCLSPAYGMAEASLTVSMKPLGDRWRSARVPVCPGQLTELVSAGQPLAQASVKVDAPAGEVGPVEIKAPWLASGYLNGSAIGSDEFFQTGDLGAVVDGELYVAGRADDIVVVRGVNRFAPDLESFIAAGIPGSIVVVLPTDRDGYEVVIGMSQRGASTSEGPSSASVRSACKEVWGVSPERVRLVGSDAILRTTSGKVMRTRMAAQRQA